MSIRLTPKASANRVGETRSLPNGEQQLVLYVTAPAENGKANEAMIRLLSEHLGVAASRLTLIGGQTSRHKRVRVE